MAGLLSRRRSFADRLTGPLPGPPQFLRLWREGGFAGATSGVSQIPVATRAPLPLSGDWLAWLGHASFLLRLGGLTVAVDPVLSERILGAGQRFTPPGLERLPPLGLLLISHNHYDHLDAPTLRPLSRDTPVVAPAGLGRWFRYRGFTAVTELDWWESVRVGAVEVSAYGPFFASIGARYPGIDVAMLPIGAYAPRWFTRNMHMDPEEAVQAACDVGARVMVPMHWGTFRLSREPALEPIERTRAAWTAAGLTLWDLAVGESRPL